MHRIVLNAASLLVIAIAYGPLLVGFGQNLWEKPYYQHYPFVLLASALLIARSLSMDLPASEQTRSSIRPRWSFPIYGTAWLLLVAAYQLLSPLLAMISFMVLLGGWLSVLAHRMGRPFPFGSWMLLALLLPPPMGLDRRWIETLQRISSSLSSQALDLFGIHHLMEGNTLVLPDKQLFVDEACSGIVSVISVVACAAMGGVWRRRAALHTLLLMAAAAVWATLFNVVRITSIALAHVQLGLDWTEGVVHTLLGLGVFSLCLGALIATDWLLHAALAEVGPRWAAQTGEPITFGQTLVRVWDSVTTNDQASEPSSIPSIDWQELARKGGGLSLGLLPLVAFGALGASQILRPTWDTTTVPVFPDTDKFVQKLQDGILPTELCGLTLERIQHKARNVQSTFGEHSVIYGYVGERGERYLVSCDFPFSGGWHDLTVCYQGVGWRLDKRVIQTSAPASSSVDEPTYELAQIDLHKLDGRSALVTFCACYNEGEPVIAPKETFHEMVIQALSRRETQDTGRLFFQVQVYAERQEGISELERRVSRQLLEEARRRFIAAGLVSLP